METRPHLFITRMLALVAFTTSAVLLGSALRPGESTCPFDADCEQVIHSSFGNLLGIPLSLIGAVVFAFLFGLTLFATAERVRLLRWLALAAGAGGVVLLCLQIFVIGQVCPFCLIIDASAILIAL